MAGYSIVAPIPWGHLECALEMLEEREFVAFGTGAYEVLKDVEPGTKVLIYVSHEEAAPEIRYSGVYRGLVSDRMEMRRLRKEGYRPPTTEGEDWDLYWTISAIEPIDPPMPLSSVQLASGRYMDTYPRGPMLSLS